MRASVRVSAQLLRHLIAPGVLILFASCGGDKGTAPLVVGSITISPSDPVLQAGSSVQLTATVKSTTGEVMTGQGATFTSNASNIATVSSTGMVVSLGPVGSAIITATAGSVHSTVTLQVVGGLPTTLTRTSPDPGEIRAGGSAGDSVRYLATDKYGNGTKGVTVFFAVTEGGGQASPASAQTDASGRVATKFTTGLNSGKNTLTANMSGIAQVVLSLTTVAGTVFITSVAPDVIVPGAAVTIAGTGFDPNSAGDVVTFDGVTAAVTSASSTQIVVTAPAQLPCVPSHKGAVQVVTAEGGAIATQTIRAGTLRTMDVGTSVLLPDGSETICTELSPASGHYAVNVLNLAPAPLSLAPFRFTGATSIPDGATFSVRQPSFTLKQDSRRSSNAARAGLPENPQLIEPSAHALELERNRQILTQLRKNFGRRVAGVGGGARASVVVAAPPAVGDTRTFRVVQVSTNLGAAGTCSNYVEITAKVVYVGSKGIVYEDVSNPLAGQMDSYFVRIGQEFDATMYPNDANYFGDPLVTDAFTDNDQHLSMVFTKSVPSNLGGFVISCDFFQRNTTDDQASNLGEIFYARAPSVSGTGFSGDTPDSWYRQIRSTIVHEVKHIASFGAHLVNNATSFEESWLEEGMARVAEETWARDNIYLGASWKGNMVYAGTLYCDVRPTNPTCNTPPYVMFQHFAGLYDVLNAPGSTSLFGRVANNDFAFYYSSWSFIRYTADHYATSEQAFLRSITQSVDLTGLANIARSAGASSDALLSGWSLAILLDENATTAGNAATSFPSWHLRDIYAGMNTDFGSNFPKPFPLEPQIVGSGDFEIDNGGIHGGSFTSFDLPGVAGNTRTFSLTGSPSLRMVIARTQ
ncbi:MAG TPA: IPT/TIG domain-containing protein [Gemmatimonadaceae bacterium]|nr:IPT/TIG domain-containing protein [Gemmatimonadaceae bacterium]